LGIWLIGDANADVLLGLDVLAVGNGHATPVAFITSLSMSMARIIASVSRDGMQFSWR